MQEAAKTMQNLLSRLSLRRRGRESDPGAGIGEPAPSVNDRRTEELQEVLGGERRWVHDQNPDTHRQWQYLHNTIQAERAATQAAPVPRYAKILRPVLVAGIFATAVGVVGILHLTTPESALRYATGKGAMSTVGLADSSEVILNHTSELIVERHDPDEPRILRLKGEALFHVRKNGTAFIVESSSGTVEVLGTKFNVRDRRGRLEVAVLTGTVRVVVRRDGEQQGIVIPAGNLITVSPGGIASLPEAILYEDYPGWLHGRLIFQKTPLASVCEELEARFDIKVRVDHPVLPAEHISGVLDSRDAESALRTLAQLTSMRIRHDANTFVLY